MKRKAITISLIFTLGLLKAQEIDTLILHYAVSKGDTIAYKRLFQFEQSNNIFHVRDYFENGQIQMDAFYSAFDKHIKEESQCNYRSNTKEG